MADENDRNVSGTAALAEPAVVSKALGQVRPLERRDLDHVANLFIQTFHTGRKNRDQRIIDDVAAYMDHFYFQGPYSGSGVNSLVHAGRDGTVCGFLGLQKTRYILGDIPLSTCIAGSLMAAKGPGYSKVGAQLLWALNTLDFDLMLTDSANRRSLAFSGPMKYQILSTNCLEWIYAFKPAAVIAYKMRRKWPAAPVGLINPIFNMADRLAQRLVLSRLPASLTDSPPCKKTDAAGFALAVPAFLKAYRLRPDWKPGELSWLLAQAEQAKRDGPLNYFLVYNSRGVCIGGYAFHARKGGMAKVLQILAADGSWGATLENLLVTAQAMGCIGVMGQAQEALMAPLYRYPGIVFYYAGGSMAQSKNAAVMAAIGNRQIFLGGLSGDRWTRFSTADFSV